MNAIQQSTGVTMPVGEQIRFLSSRTGAWVLDTYMETAELGNRTIADLLADLFDQNGQLILSGLNNWLGYWQPNYPYRVGDTFKDDTSTNAYVTLNIHVSSTIDHDMQVGNIDLVVAGVVGPQGPVGPVGPVGPKGPAGETVKVIGSFGLSKTPTDLPTNGFIPANWDGTNRPVTAHQFLAGEGMSYSPLSQVDPLYGHLYSYVGTTVSAAGWVDVGSAAGPPGLPGVPGGSYVVVAHLATSPPDVNNPPIVPPGGLLVIDLDDNSHGQASIPAGGTTGQFLAKVTDTSYDTFWKTQPIGPPGPTGPQGPVGPQGPTGPPGTDFIDAPLDSKAYGRMNAGWTPVVPLTGATMTGALIVPSNAVTTQNPGGLDGLRIDGPAGSGNAIAGQRAGSLRWRVVLGNSTAESGSNTGSDFTINRYSDTGVIIDTPVSISRANGGVTITIAGNNLSNQPHLNSAPGIVKGWYGSVNGVDRWGVIVGNSVAESGANAGSDFQLNAFSDAGVFLGTPFRVARAASWVYITGNGAAAINETPSGGHAAIRLNKASGANVANISGWNNGTNRWTLTLGDSTTEGGANAGSNFVIGRSGDTGVGIDNPLVINRASGAVTLTGTLNGVGAVFSGNVNVGSLTVPSLGTGAISGAQINGTTIIASNYLQTSVASGAAALYLSAQANASGHQYQLLSDTVGQFIISDNTSGGTRFYITAAGACVVVSNLTCSGNFNTNAIAGTTITASSYLQAVCAAPAMLILTATSVRQWSIRAAGDGYLYFYDDSGAALRFYCETGGRVVFNQGIYSATTLQVVGGSTLTGTVTCNAINCTAINTQNNNLTMGTGDITCQNITTTQTISQNVGGATAVHQLNNSWRTWQVRCLATSGQFDIVDASAGVQRLVIDLSGTVSVIQAAAVGLTLDVGSTGIGYTGLAATRIAFQNISGTNLTFYTNGTAKGVQTFGAPSDERLKQRIAAPEGDALAQLNALKLISYDVRLTPNVPWAHFGYGFSAQQMRPIIPEAVQEVPIAFRPEDPEKPYTEDEIVLTLDLMPLVARLVGAVQQLTRRLEILEGGR